MVTGSPQAAVYNCGCIRFLSINCAFWIPVCTGLCNKYDFAHAQISRRRSTFKSQWHETIIKKNVSTGAEMQIRLRLIFYSISFYDLSCVSHGYMRQRGIFDSKSQPFCLRIVFFVLTREKRKRFNQAKSAKIWSDSESYFSSPMWQWCIHLWDFLSLCFLCVKIKADWGNIAETRARDCFAINLVTDLFFDSTVDSLFCLPLKIALMNKIKVLLMLTFRKTKLKAQKVAKQKKGGLLAVNDFVTLPKTGALWIGPCE